MTDECIDHGQAHRRGGYGHAYYQGKATSLHRVVWCKANNKNLVDIKGLHVRHKCDNSRCINSSHLEIGTAKQNENDKISRGRKENRKGEASYVAKVSGEDVLDIRKKYRDKTMKQQELAILYSISQSAISLIVNRKNWSHI